MKHAARQRPALLAIFFVVALLAGCSGILPPGAPKEYVKVRGTNFMIGDRPYYFAGANMWYGCYLGSPGPTGDRPRLTREMDMLKARGIDNLRVLGVSESSMIIRSVTPSVVTAPGAVDEDLLVGLDFLLDEAAKRDMRVVVYLTNYWEWSGGMSQYNVWADDVPVVDPHNPAQGWHAFMDFSAGFYSNAKAAAIHREVVRSVVTRVNTVNGLRYADDPTIMAWQLANEPRPGTDGPNGERNLPPFYAWIEETAAFIHTLDANHLVSTGSEGLVGCVNLPEAFMTAHRPPAIDYLTCHLWPYNWGWFDPKRIGETLPVSESNALEYIAKHIGYARELGKPLVMDEFGLARDSTAFLAGSPTTARDRYFEKILGMIQDSASAGAPIAGSNVWAWGGEGRARHADGLWRPGDPFVGDPPQEAQGLNSMFDSDSVTLAIIQAHAARMAGLRASD
jgi:mannan endo-1,4-beta-mannosidase